MNTTSVICQHCGRPVFASLIGAPCPLCGNTLTNHVAQFVPLPQEPAWAMELAA